jgi:hypothetical protein
VDGICIVSHPIEKMTYFPPTKLSFCSGTHAQGTDLGNVFVVWSACLSTATTFPEYKVHDCFVFRAMLTACTSTGIWDSRRTNLDQA